MRKSSYTKIGIFVCTALALAVIAVILLGAGSFRQKELLFETYVEETVQGISEGSDVKYRGIPIGSVKSVSFAFAKYRGDYDSPDYSRASRYARIVFAIDVEKLPDGENFVSLIDEQISRGLRVHMKSQGITGLVYLDLDYEDSPKKDLPVPWQPEYKYVPSAPTFVKTLTDVMQNVAQEIHDLASRKGDITNLTERVHAILDNANSVLKSADLSLTGIPGAVAGISNMVEKASDFLVSAKDGTAGLPDLIGNASNLVTEASVFVKGIKDDLTAVSASSTNLISHADTAVADTLPGVENAVNEISRLIEELSETIRMLRDEPRRLFNQPSPENMP